MSLSFAFTATQADAGQRLDALVLAHAPDSTRGLVRDAIALGAITVNGVSAPKGVRVREGDAIAVDGLLTEDEVCVRPDQAVAEAIASRIVYDDGTLLGIDKPAGMAVLPLSPYETGALACGVVALRPEFAIVGHEPLAAGAVHRIDAVTSGLVIFAANNFVFAAMRSLFAEHAVAKTYLALVEGAVAKPGAVACELAHAPYLDHCRMVAYSSLSAGERHNTRPLFAETRYTPIRTAQGKTLLKVEIATGVTHQIRAQLAMAGHPIVGDTLYGARPAQQIGICLHSFSAAFVHPATGRKTTISTPRPSFASN